MHIYIFLEPYFYFVLFDITDCWHLRAKCFMPSNLSAATSILNSCSNMKLKTLHFRLMLHMDISFFIFVCVQSFGSNRNFKFMFENDIWTKLICKLQLKCVFSFALKSFRIGAILNSFFLFFFLKNAIYSFLGGWEDNSNDAPY